MAGHRVTTKATESSVEGSFGSGTRLALTEGVAETVGV
jgi:hypothetical protein